MVVNIKLSYCLTFFNQIKVEVSGAKTRAIFNEVFDKMVADAQPIPGFRRVKGGTILFIVDKYFFLVF